MKPLRDILYWPALLAIVTASGLITALVSDGFGDALGAACLGGVAFRGVWPFLPRHRR
jgi:uncharacterized membrane protein YjjP (DUF1212 family)